jgi:hypothetical protein
MGCVLSAAGLNFDSDFLVALQFKPTESDSRIPYHDHHHRQFTPCLHSHPHKSPTLQPPPTTFPTSTSFPLAQMRHAQTAALNPEITRLLNGLLFPSCVGLRARYRKKPHESRRKGFAEGVGELLGSLRQPVSRFLPDANSLE